MQSGPIWFLAGVAIYGVALFGLQQRAIEAQQAFFRRYREKRGLDMEFEPTALQSEFEQRPARFIVGLPRFMFRGFTLQMKHVVDDPELEALRRRSVARQNLVLAAVYLLAIIPISFSCIGQW